MKKILPLIFVGLLASILIFYKFPNLPKYLAFDEVEFSRLALSLKDKPYIPYSPLATGHSTLYFYIILFSFNIFGVTNFALRFPAAVFGILSVVMFYLIIRLSFRAERSGVEKSLKRSLDFLPHGKAGARDNILPLLFTIIFLSSRWFLNFARFSFETTFLLFLELTSIYFFIKAGRKNTVSSFCLIMSGFFAGLAFLSYTPGRIFFLLPLSFIVFMSLRGVERRSNLNFRDCFATARNDIMKPLLYFLIPFIIITTPLNLYFLNNKDSRIDQQFFLRNSEMTTLQKIFGLWHNISSTALMFNIKGDVNGRHNYPLKPALNPILGLLFIIGFVVAIKSAFVKTTADKQWNNNNNKLFILYFFLSVFPALMTYPWENPNMLRTFTVIPSMVYFVGQGIIVIARSKTTKQSLKLLRLPRSLWSLAMTVVVAFFILLSVFYELRTYFKYQPSVFDQAFEMKKPLPSAFSEPNPYEKSH